MSVIRGRLSRYSSHGENQKLRDAVDAEIDKTELGPGREAEIRAEIEAKIPGEAEAKYRRSERNNPRGDHSRKRTLEEAWNELESRVNEKIREEKETIVVAKFQAEYDLLKKVHLACRKYVRSIDDFKRLIEENNIPIDLLQGPDRDGFRNDDILGVICSQGRLDLLEYLVDERGFTRDHIRRQENSALVHACFHKYWDLARYLIYTFELTKEDALSRNCQILYDAIGNNSIYGVRYIIGKFGVTKADIEGRKIEIIQMMEKVCLRNMDIIKYLVNVLELTIEDFRQCDDSSIIRKMVTRGNWKLIRYLKTLGMNKDDILKRRDPDEDDYNLFEVLASFRSVDTLRFLVKEFDITYLDLDNSSRSPLQTPFMRSIRKQPLKDTSFEVFRFLKNEVYTSESYIHDLIERALEECRSTVITLRPYKYISEPISYPETRCLGYSEMNSEQQANTDRQIEYVMSLERRKIKDAFDSL